MGRRTVTAPDGERWSVARRWLNRSPPKPWTRLRRRRSASDDAETVAGWSFEAFMNGLDSIAGIVLAAAVAVVLALVIFVLLPLLGIAFDERTLIRDGVLPPPELD